MAWIDESGHEAAGLAQVVLAAVTVPDASYGAVDDGMRGLLLPGQRSMHWRDESSARRKLIVDEIMRHDITAYVATVREVPLKQKEAARARALTAILRMLEADDVPGVIIEGRSGGDAHDRRTVRRARSSVELQRFGSKTEPMLWVADAVASIRSAGAMFHGGQPLRWDRALALATEHTRRLRA